MKPSVEELLARIHALEDQVEQEYAHVRAEWQGQREALADHFLELQRRQKVGLWTYLRTSRWPVVLSAPLIYSGWIAFALLDLFISLYQAVCFPLYGIPSVRRSDYLVFDRTDLPYLNLIEKFNCVYCSYGNGVVAFAREVTARTEQYWCPIKHARRMRDAHPLYPTFFEHGDAEAFRQGLERLRQEASTVPPQNQETP
ncbi:MAG: hypothetical protein PHI55_15975 [Burkholderiaceae bacterium]|nr:hypothetical protein [Burkholderiaceae bacterium]